MNTIKIYLAQGGSVADLKKDFPLYQGAYQNKLLNVYVPTSIIAPQSDAAVSTAVKIGMVYTKRSGKIGQSAPYHMRYLKNLTYNGIEYALYERMLPQEFTLYAGQGANAPTLVANVVNIKDGLSLDPVVLSIITSQTVSLDVMPSANLDGDPPIPPSELEIIRGELNAITARINGLDDRALIRAYVPFINSKAPTPREVYESFSRQGYDDTNLGVYMTDLSNNMWIIADRGFNADPTYPLVKVGSETPDFSVIDGGEPDSF